MCDCFHLAFPNWHAASSGTGAGRRLRAPEPGTEDDSTCDEPPQFTEGERPRPQGSSPVEEYPEKYTDSDKECEAEHDPHHKSGTGKKTKKSGLGSMFEKRSTPKMSKLQEVPSPESGVIVKTAKDGCAEGLVYGGGGKEGIFIKEVVPESPASKSLKLKEGDQILSATVYFDNVSYEDAIQILEHAQAYKVKLCLKRKPDITETEPAIESDVIPEEDVYAPEMREQGKNKRRGDARISWPKFPSFGKGRKSRFTRSHSSSEADEQKRLELSPTTSDTESPIKSQDALKGKKKHKIKLNVLKKRGRISSSEDQDTDATTAQMLSPECLESPSGETPQVYVTEDLKVVEDLRHEQNDQELTEPQSVQHKAELITIDSTLKTEDLTVALAGQESPSGIKSPDGKKKKKERSELKMKILGKDKSHKKDAKAKSSPKRLKTLGASIEIADQPGNEKSDVIPSIVAVDANTQIISSESSKVISAKSVTSPMEMSVPKVELEISDVALIQKSPQKGEDKTKKGKDVKQKQETKTGQTFKLPKIGFSDIATEEKISKMSINVEERTTKIEQLTTEGPEVRDDPYERLSKSSLSMTKLPKREDIEIPGMEDMSVRTTAKGIKEPKAVFTGHYEDIQAETVQLSIDVDSVKEAVSKLPGYKLPKVDTSGVPIPEEITVIDANAQRISVKTPTKTKHDAHLSKFDITASPEISKTKVKLPKITPADLTSEELLVETMVDLKKPEKQYETDPKHSDKEVYKREHIIIPGKESVHEVAMLQTQGTEGITSEYEAAATIKSKKTKTTMKSFGIAKSDIRIPDIGIYLPKQNISEQKADNAKGERTIFLQDVEMSKTETRNKIEGVVSDVKIPEIDGIEYIDSADGSQAKRDVDIRLTGFGVNLDASSPKADISIPEIRGEVKDVETEEHTFKLPKYGAVTPNISVIVPHADKDINIDGAEIKTLEREGKGGKFKMPEIGISMPKVKGHKIDLSLSKKDVDVTLPEAKAEVELRDIPEVDATLGNVDISIPEQKLEVEKPELEIKPWQAEGELDGQGGKFKMPKFGVKMPKIKRSEFDLSSSKKDVDITLPEAKAEVKFPEAPKIDTSLGKAEVLIPESKVGVKKPEGKIKPLQTDVELEGQGGKVQMQKFGITMPKVKGPEIHFGLSKKDGDVTLPEVKADIKVPEVELKEPSAQVDIKAPEIKVAAKGTDGSPRKFKMPTFKLPKFGIVTPNVSVEVPDMDKDVKIDGTDIHIPDEGSAVHIAAPSIDIEGSSIEMKTTGTEYDGKGSKFKMPHFGISMPKVKGPKIDLSPSKKDVDVKFPEVDLGKIDVSVPDAKMEIKKPEMEMQLLQTEGELDGQGEKFKMPKFGIKMPKVKGPEFDFDVTQPQTKVEVKHPDAPKIDVSLGKAEFLIPQAKAKVEKAELEIKPLQTDVEGQGSKFKIPKFEMSMPKVKGPEFHLGLSKKDVDVTLPESKADVKLPDVELKETSAKVEIKAPEIEVVAKDTEGSPSKFKMPNFSFSMPKVKGPDIDLSISKKDTDITLPGTKAEIKLAAAPKIDASIGKAEVLIPDAKVEVKKPEVKIEPLQTGIELEGHSGQLKMPKFGISMPKVKGPEIDFSLSKKDVDITLPARAEVNVPDVELKEPSAKVEIKAPEFEAQSSSVKGSPSKLKLPTFKFPRFGATTPNVSTEVPDIGKEIKIDGGDMHISVPQSDVEVPEVKAEVHLPEVEVKKPSGGVVIEQQPGVEVDAKLKKPRFSLPRFSFSKASVKAPEVDASLQDVNVAIPADKVEIKVREVDMKLPECGAEVDGQGSKFKMPKFGISMPKVKGPEIDLSLSKKDVDITLPDTKAEVKLPDVKIKQPSATVEIKAPEIEAQAGNVEGSPSKLKMPTFTLPKFGIATPKVSMEVPDVDKDIKIDGATVDVTAPSIDTEGLSVDVKAKGSELEGSEGKFKMPKFGISMPKVKGPEIDLSLSKKDVDITLPKAKAEIKLPNVEVKEPEVEIKAPETKAATKDTEGSPLKFKIPTLKLPKFGISTPSAAIEVPDNEGDIKIDEADIKIPEEVLAVHITAPSIDTKGPSIDIKTTGTEHERKGSKFKLPSLGFSGPQVKHPDTYLSLSKKDVDVTLPEVKADVKLSDVGLKEPSAEVEMKGPQIKVATKSTEGSPSRFKMPTFKLPKFGISTPSATIEVPYNDGDIKIDEADIKIPEEVLAVHITAPSIDTKGPSIDIKTTGTEHEGKESKFKLPSLGFSGPQVKHPDIDLSLSKKDVDVTLPEVKADVKLSDVGLKEPSAEVEMKGPQIKVATKSTEGSPSRFKMPTFKLPKFGISTPSAAIEVPDNDGDIKIDEADIKIPEEVLAVHITAPSIDTKRPSIDIKTKGTEHEGKESKFKLPSLGFSGPQVKQPDIDLGLSKKDVDVTLPEVKADVSLPDVGLKEPSAEVEIKGPQIKVATKSTEGSPSKFKMPTFKFPKFGGSTPSATVEVPDMDSDVKIDGSDIKIPQEVLAVHIAAPNIDSEGPSIEIKTTGTEHEGKGSKFKLPSLGFSGPQVKHPDIDLSLSKKDVDVTLPEAKAEVKLPDIKLKEPSSEVEIKAPEINIVTKGTEGSPSKFKMPTFKFPKFGGSTPSATVEVPDMDSDVKIDEADIKIPEEVLAVHIAAPNIDSEGPSIDIKTTGTEHEGKGSKFKLPSLGFSGPQVKQPDIDLSLSKKDVDVTLPEAKAEVKLPDIKLKEPSAEVEIKAPEIKIATKNTEGSPSRFKMPTFKFPKFGGSTPSATVEVPDMDSNVKIDGADIKIPEEVLAVHIAAPNIDCEGPSIDIKTTGTEHEGKGSKFKLPSLGFSGPQVKQPDIDLSLSKKDVHVTLPEAKAEVKLPEVEIREPVDSISQSAMLEGDAKLPKTSWTLPRFSFSKTSVKSPEADVNLDVPKVDVTLSETKTDVHVPDIDIKESSGISIQGTPATDLDAKLKKPRFSLPTFSFSKQSTKESNVDVSLPDVDVSLPEVNVEVKQPEVDSKPPAVDVELEGQESKFKMPKFGFSMPKVKGPEKDVDITLQEAKAEVKLPDVNIKQPSATVEIKAPEIEAQAGNVEGSPSKFKMPTFTLPKFGAATPKVSVEVPDVDKDIKIDVAKVDVTAPSIDTEGLSVDVKAKGSELEGSGSKFKMPKFGISMPKVKGPEIDLSLSKKDVDITLPDTKAEVKLPDVKIKQPSATVEIKAPEIEAQAGNVEGSPSKFKMPTFTLPKFGAATPKVSVEVPDVDKDIKIDGAKVDVTAPSIDTEGLSVDVKAKGSELEGLGGKFKIPKFGISMPKVTGPEIDLSLSKKEDVNVTLPEAKAEVKLPNVEVKEPEGAISVPDAPTVEVETKLKRSNWSFPKFSFSRTGGKAPDVDVNLETPKVDVTSPEAKAEVQEPSGAISMEEPPATELDANLKKPKFSLPRFSFSKSSVQEPEVNAELPHVDVSLPEGEVIVKQPEMKIKAPEVKTEVKLPEIEVKDSSASVEIKASETEVGGSPLKFKMPTLKTPKFASYDVTVEAPDADKVSKTDGAKLKEDVTVNIKGPSVNIKTDVSKAAITDSETPKTETDSVGLGSPSKFKLPSFKMPRLSFSRSNLEDEHVPVDTECKEDQLEMEGEPKGDSKSPKVTLTSFGDILKNFDVEFDVQKVEQNPETSKDIRETDEPSGKQLQTKEKETKQEATKSPERTGWFKFPRFGLSSPSEPAKISEKDKHKDEKSPVGETVDDEISPTCSVQSSDAFADISSAMTSDVGLSLSSPTKVTVKYSDPNTATGLGETHSNIITSTTRTQLISVEPNLPEKITILSSGVSSSSEDTLRLESGKIHVITSNIQATPEAQHAKLATAVQIQSAGGLPLESEANKAASWSVKDSQGSKRTVFERHLVRETSSERSESKETIVITKQVTRMFDSSEPISGETASSIQRLRDSVHSEKMRFFDGADE